MSYADVTLKEWMFQLSVTGKFAEPNSGLDNLSHQGAWDSWLMYSL
jgi:hypothetical protein